MLGGKNRNYSVVLGGKNRNYSFFLVLETSCTHTGGIHSSEKEGE